MTPRALGPACVAVFLAHAACAAPKTAEPAVSTGIDVLVESRFEALRGKQVGLITNNTGRDRRGRSTADLLFEAPGVKLVALFSPEHGIRGRQPHGQSVQDSIDPKTRLPVYSLYGSVKKPTPDMLNAIDVLIFDIQDVGTRFYTYLTTMAMAMEAAKKREIAFWVLDRPNPLGGDILEGPVLDLRHRHFTAYFDVPVRHGLTAGEMAGWFNTKTGLGARLTVVPVKGWVRQARWPDTGLPFVPPSPNIRTPTTALLYPGIGMFEATNVSVGRGTDEPFERFGAPWMNGPEMARRLDALALPGFRFYQTFFTPAADLYAGEVCSGVRIVVTDAQAARPVDVFVHGVWMLRELSPKEFLPRWEEVARVTGDRQLELAYRGNRPVESVLKHFREGAERFRKDRDSFLLYPGASLPTLSNGGGREQNNHSLPLEGGGIQGGGGSSR